jgi:hypothetical protein
MYKRAALTALFQTINDAPHNSAVDSHFKRRRGYFELAFIDARSIRRVAECRYKG